MADATKIKEKIKNKIIVEEPINQIIQTINHSNENILVLKGVRGSGRTTVLLTQENQNKIGENISIYHHFEHASFGVTSHQIGLDFLKHRYELEMASVLLRFIDNHNLFNPKTEQIATEVRKLRQLFVYDINHLGSNKSFKSNIIEPGHYTEDLLSEIKDAYQPAKLSFLIDRFDWMFNRSSEAQQCIKNYFSLFDQVILTTDDEDYTATYKTLEVDYGKDKNTIKEIIKKHLANEENFSLTLISDETLNYIIDQAKGDIETILQTIFSYSYYSNNELNNALKEEVQTRVLKREQIKYKDHLKPKLYI